MGKFPIPRVGEKRMFTRILFYAFALSSMIAVESAGATRIDYMQDVLVLRIIAEKHQSIENGLRFNVELENKIAESISFTTTGRKTPFNFKIVNPSNELNLTRYSFENIDTISDGFKDFIIGGNSKIQLGTIVFSKYLTEGSRKEKEVKVTRDGIEKIEIHAEVEFVENKLVPGIYVITVDFSGHIKDDSNTTDSNTTDSDTTDSDTTDSNTTENEADVDEFYRGIFSLFSEPFEVVME